MEESSARGWVEREFNVPRETMERFDRFAEFLQEENGRQNLISAASVAQMWGRHIADSAQLVRWAPSPRCSWLDIGAGAGFPGLVVAALHQGRVTLVEARKLRVDFLRRAAAVLGVEHRIEVIGCRVEWVDQRIFDVISARAFAPLPKLLDLGARFSTNMTRWILPKGRNVRSELASVDSSWQGDFRVEPSLTDPVAGIIVAEAVERKRA